MPFDPVSPHYQRIREQIAQDLANGIPQADQKFPSERDMIERFGCTRVTLRQALQQLEAEGRVYRENRRGWFVSPQRIRYDPTRISGFMDYVSAKGRTPRTECLQAELRPAGSWLARRMGLESAQEPVFFLQRRRWIDRRPVLLEFNALLASWCPGLLDVDLDTSLTRVLREHFARVQSRCELQMHIGTVNEQQAELLQLSPGSTSVYLERLNFGEADQPVEFDQEFWRPDALSVVMETLYPGKD